MGATQPGFRSWGADAPRICAVGQGTWQLERNDRRAAVKALRLGLDLGMSHIDTAAFYGQGEAERLVGEALLDRRDRAFLVSKIVPDHARGGDAIRACEASLRRLKTDYLDGYLLHWLPPHPLPEAVEAMERLRVTGKIRAWGVSNFDEEKLEELVALAGPGRVCCNQVMYHLGERAIEHAVMPFCAAHGIAVVGYSPFGAGKLPLGPQQWAALNQVAREQSATPHQVALAFLLRDPNVFVIPKAVTCKHVEDNRAAAALVLSDEQARRIDDVFPRGPRRPGIPLPT